VIEPRTRFGGLETVLDRPAMPSTATSVSMVVPAGHQVVKKASHHLRLRRRISRPRVHKPSFALVELAGIEIGQFENSTNHAASPLVRPLRTAFPVGWTPASMRCPRRVAGD